MKIYVLNAAIIVFIFALSSCMNEKKAIYFNNVPDSTFTAAAKEVEPIIQKNDLLNITVSSLNPEASLLFNTPNLPPVLATTTGGTNTQLTGYLVNRDGTIQFPMLGRMQVAGMTKNQLADELAKQLSDKKLLKDPIVNIRFLNFRVTVIGEVNHPSVVSVANEKISILEAIGLAGDLTVFAKRSNVLLIRDEDGVKTTKRINLNSAEILSSPYYYLKTNDIVYAEPNNARISATSNARQIIPIVLSGLSFFAIIIDRILFR